MGRTTQAGTDDWVAQDKDLLDITSKFYAQLARTELFYTLARENFERTKFLTSQNKYEEKLRFFANTIGDHRLFDTKQPGKGFNFQDVGKESMFNGEKYNWTDYGNMNFGFAARIFGISLLDAKFGAGMQQVFGKGKGSPDWSNFNGFFDGYDDTQMIIKGYFMQVPWDY